jgi:hypothetical protein
MEEVPREAPEAYKFHKAGVGRIGVCARSTSSNFVIFGDDAVRES